jgi:hypothetical protein
MWRMRPSTDWISLLSWNFKHLANVRREGLIAAVNQQEGYWHALRLLSPLEVEDENQT